MRRRLMAFLTVFTIVLSCGAVQAVDLPQAATSPVAGITFDDPPIPLPVAHNFQIAMQTAASELGLSCRGVESYGWRMQQSEQQRVNAIFTTTVERLRSLGYLVEARTPSSVDRDITVFTAHRRDKDLLVMWSAGELGLVLLMCDAQPATVAGTGRSGLSTPQQKNTLARNFSPIGSWRGTFVCARGISGGTLKITAVSGTHIEGAFQFYATRRNAQIPNGGYYLSGEYDPQGNRVLLNPGNWIERPKGFNAAPIIGGFDPATMKFSGVFQGVAGCTSIEAHYVGKPQHVGNVKKTLKNPVKKKPKAKTAQHPMNDITAVPAPDLDATMPPPLPPVVDEPLAEKLPPPVSVSPAGTVSAAPQSPAVVVKPKVEVTPPHAPDAAVAPTQVETPPLVGHAPAPPIKGDLTLPTPPDKLPAPPPIQPGIALPKK